MKSLNKIFINVFEPVLIQRGFKRKRSAFCRLVNEQIVQLFTIKKYSGDSFTMQYLIMPACSGEIVEYPVDENRIGDLIGNEGALEWEIDDNVEDSMRDALEKCEKYLFTWFDYICDYKTYYDFALEKHRKNIESMGNIITRCEPWVFRAPRAVGFYEICLYLKDYENAIAWLEMWKGSAESSYKKRTEDEIERKNMLAKKIEMHNMKIRETENFRDNITSPDEMLKEKECITLDSYYKVFGK